jgi:hypothetical protein
MSSESGSENVPEQNGAGAQPYADSTLNDSERSSDLRCTEVTVPHAIYDYPEASAIDVDGRLGVIH